ncbi:hypothetical protein LCGC14_2037030, partial [marine sediment metagenome]
MLELTGSVQPDAQSFLANLRRQGTPDRVHYMELFLDGEVKDAIVGRFDLAAGLSEDDPHYAQKREIAIQRFLGYDYVSAALELAMPLNRTLIDDTADLPRLAGRAYMEEHEGPITSWEQFEQYPWPDPATAPDGALAWFQENLPEDMCLVSNCGAHFCEHLCWLMGYESLCYALYDQRDLVEAIYRKILDITTGTMTRLKQYSRIEAVWGSDDMGFKTSTMFSPTDMRQFVLPGHKAAAEMAHQAGRLYLLHSCGNLRQIMPDLLDDVKIDAKHSFEDTIESIADAKADYGDRCAVIGGIDVDFLCRADEPAIRSRVRDTLDACMPGGGFCLGSGNSVANYVPVDNYLTMLDDNAAYLGRLGQQVLDVGQLLGFEFMQADGLAPGSYLASGIDAWAESPGLPLAFGRAFPQTISQRYETGPLGRGWSHNWDFSLDVGDDGTVTITGPSATRRTFLPDIRGGYFPQPGDYATLTDLGGGAFSLREKGGLLTEFRADGKLDYAEDTNGNRIPAGYTGEQLTSLTHSSGATLLLDYDAQGMITSVTDPLGPGTEDDRVTVYSYDTSGEHLVSVHRYDQLAPTYYQYVTG